MIRMGVFISKENIIFSLRDFPKILQGLKFCEELSKVLKLPIKFTSIRRNLIDENLKKNIKQILPVDPIKYGDWL